MTHIFRCNILLLVGTFLLATSAKYLGDDQSNDRLLSQRKVDMLTNWEIFSISTQMSSQSIYVSMTNLDETARSNHE